MNMKDFVNRVDHAAIIGRNGARRLRRIARPDAPARPGAF